MATLVAVVVVGWIGFKFATSTPASTSAEPDSTGAWVAAQDFVKRHLKDPADADFGSLTGDFQKTDDVVTNAGDGKFHIHAWVDAKNSFGGKVRTHFDADVQYAQDGNWHLASLQFDE